MSNIVNLKIRNISKEIDRLETELAEVRGKIAATMKEMLE